MQYPLPLDVNGQVEPKLWGREQTLIDIRINKLRGELARYRRLELRALHMLRDLGVDL